MLAWKVVYNQNRSYELLIYIFLIVITGYIRYIYISYITCSFFREMYIPSKFNKINYSSNQYFIEIDKDFFSAEFFNSGYDFYLTIHRYEVSGYTKTNIQIKKVDNNYQIYKDDIITTEMAFCFDGFGYIYGGLDIIGLCLIQAAVYWIFDLKKQLNNVQEVNCCLQILNLQTNIKETHLLAGTYIDGANTAKPVPLMGKKYRILKPVIIYSQLDSYPENVYIYGEL